MLTEALQKRIHPLITDTLRQFFTMYAEEFSRYKVHELPNFHPAVMHFNEVFLFMQFLEGLMYGYKTITHKSMELTRETMSDPYKIIDMLMNPEFMEHWRKLSGMGGNKDEFGI